MVVVGLPMEPIVTSPAPTLGALLRHIRAREGWTLKEMSARSGIPVSTLSKIEHDRLSLTFDKLHRVSQRLGLTLSELLAELDDDSSTHCDYYCLSADRRSRRMIPVIRRIRAEASADFAELIHGIGERFLYVLRGRVILHTEFYSPFTLEAGQSVYFDSSMGHACLVGDGCDEAEVLEVRSSPVP